MILTKTQKEILKYLTVDFLTIKQIAKRRQTSIRAVYKTIEILKKKGVLAKRFTTLGGYSTQKVQNKNQKIRLHNIQETIKILKKSKKYENYLKANSNKYQDKDFTAILNKNYIDLYTSITMDFYGDTVDQAYFKAIDFFRRAYIKIENRFDILIDKEGYLNKRWVRQHIAETNNEIAEKANTEGERIVVHDQEDGKEAIITDNSFNMNELEFVHPTKANHDAKAVLRHLQSMREHPESLTIAELSFTIKEIATGQLNLTKLIHANTLTLTNFMKIMQSMMPKPQKQPKKPQERQSLPAYIG